MADLFVMSGMVVRGNPGDEDGVLLCHVHNVNAFHHIVQV